ncbi:MAG: methionine/alanine import family NSS transporter small subunit [Arachnia sp.]
MTAGAIAMMLVAMITLWGGLAAAAISLFSREDQSAGDEVSPGASAG